MIANFRALFVLKVSTTKNVAHSILLYLVVPVVLCDHLWVVCFYPIHNWLYKEYTGQQKTSLLPPLFIGIRADSMMA